MSDQPWQWEVPESSGRIKRSMNRQDAFERVTGQAVYTRDVAFPGMLYARTLTSPYAHAKIVRMDTAQAEALVGVRDILRFDDPAIAKDGGAGSDTAMSYSILTLPGTSDFYQHPMGVTVVADSEEICDRALRLIKIEWEERPFVLDMEESAKAGAPKIMSEVRRMNFRGSSNDTGNIITTEEREIGNVQEGFAEADNVIEYSIKRAMNSPAGVEAMACVAQWRNDFLDLWVHHQANPQSNLSAQPMGMFPGGFGMNSSSPPFTHWSKITVRFPYQGSWFGGLAWLAYSTLFIRLTAVLAKRAAGKPVKVFYDESSFYCGGDEAGNYTCKVGAKKDGTITAYHWHMAGARNPAVDKTYECTGIPNIRGTQEWAFTNRGLPGVLSSWRCFLRASQCDVRPRGRRVRARSDRSCAEERWLPGARLGFHNKIPEGKRLPTEAQPEGSNRAWEKRRSTGTASGISPAQGNWGMEGITAWASRPSTNGIGVRE